MRYGNTVHELKRGVLVGLIVGGIGYVFSAAMFIFVTHLPLDRLIPLGLVVALPALAIGLAVAPTVLFSIHIDGGRVEQRFFDRYVLSSAKIQDFEHMKTPSVPFAAVLRFNDGTRIRVWGMHIGILSQLERDLNRIKLTAEQSRKESGGQAAVSHAKCSPEA